MYFVSDFCDIDRYVFVLFVCLCLCIVIFFMWTPGRIATTTVEANEDLNKEIKKHLQSLVPLTQHSQKGPNLK